MTGVDEGRAAFIQEQYLKHVTETSGAAGTEQTIVTALASETGANALSTRIAPYMLAGLAPITVKVFDAAFVFEIGETIEFEDDDDTFVITGVHNDPNTDTAELTLRGPDPS